MVLGPLGCVTLLRLRKLGVTSWLGGQQVHCDVRPGRLTTTSWRTGLAHVANVILYSICLSPCADSLKKCSIPLRFDEQTPLPVGQGHSVEDREPRPIHVWHDGGEALPMDDDPDVPWHLIAWCVSQLLAETCCHKVHRFMLIA